MYSVECFRTYVNQRLAAAAEEIVGVFQKTIAEYKEEIDRQSRLVEVVRTQEIKIHTIGDYHYQTGTCELYMNLCFHI